MLKLTKVQLFLLGAITLTTFSVPYAKGESITINQEDTIKAGNKQPEQSTWTWIKNLFKQVRRDGADLGGGKFCSISSSKAKPRAVEEREHYRNDYTTSKMFTDTPVFVWEGEVIKIRVVYYDENFYLQESWSRERLGGEKSVTYNDNNQGETLQPGRIYNIEYYYLDGESSEPDMSDFSFQILEEGTDRQNIEQSLKTLEGTHIGENLIEERAIFFAEEGYYNDMVTELFSNPNPSEDFKKKLIDIRRLACLNTEDNSQ